MDAEARHRMLLLVGVPVAMRVPPPAEYRDDEVEDLEQWDDEEADEELDDEDDGEDGLDESEEDDEEPEEVEDLDEEDDIEDEPVDDAAAARHRLLLLAGVELRSALHPASNPAPGRQVNTEAGMHRFKLPIGSTILADGMVIVAGRKMTRHEATQLYHAQHPDRPQSAAAAKKAAGVAPVKRAPAKALGPKKLTPAQAERELSGAEEWAQAARDGRVTRPAAAKRIRQMALRLEEHAAYIGLGGPEQKPWQTDEQHAAHVAEVARRREEAMREPKRLRALADEIEKRPTKAPGVVPAKRTPAKAAKTAAPRRRPDLTGEGGLSSDPAVREAQIENRIRQAYRDALASGGGHTGGRVSLADIRERLGAGVNRHEVDDALRRMSNERPLTLQAQENQQRLTRADLDSELQMGMRRYHFLDLADSSLRPLPGTPARAATPRKATPKTPQQAADAYATRFDKARAAGLSDADAAKYAHSNATSVTAWKRANAPAKPETPRARAIREGLTPTEANAYVKWLQTHPGASVQEWQAATKPRIVVEPPTREPGYNPPELARRDVLAAAHPLVADASLTEADIAAAFPDWRIPELRRLAREYGHNPTVAKMDRPALLAFIAHAIKVEHGRSPSYVRSVDEGEERLAGQDVTPGHDQLHHYWTRGEGLAKWADSPKPWTTLVAHLTKYVGPERAKRFASQWVYEVFGLHTGNDAYRVMHGGKPRGHRIGPG